MGRKNRKSTSPLTRRQKEFMVLLEKKRAIPGTLNLILLVLCIPKTPIKVAGMLRRLTRIVATGFLTTAHNEYGEVIYKFGKEFTP